MALCHDQCEVASGRMLSESNLEESELHLHRQKSYVLLLGGRNKQGVQSEGREQNRKQSHGKLLLKSMMLSILNQKES